MPTGVEVPAPPPPPPRQLDGSELISLHDEVFLDVASYGTPHDLRSLILTCRRTRPRITPSMMEEAARRFVEKSASDEERECMAGSWMRRYCELLHFRSLDPQTASDMKLAAELLDGLLDGEGAEDATNLSPDEWGGVLEAISDDIGEASFLPQAEHGVPWPVPGTMLAEEGVARPGPEEGGRGLLPDPEDSDDDHRILATYRTTPTKGKKKKRKKKKKKRTKKAAPTAPKRPLSPYMLFQHEMRPRLKAEHPGKDEVGLAKLMGAKWRSLGDEEKRPYSDRYKENKRAYDAELAGYTVKPTACRDPLEDYDVPSENHPLGKACTGCGRAFKRIGVTLSFVNCFKCRDPACQKVAHSKEYCKKECFELHHKHGLVQEYVAPIRDPFRDTNQIAWNSRENLKSFYGKEVFYFAVNNIPEVERATMLRLQLEGVQLPTYAEMGNAVRAGQSGGRAFHRWVAGLSHSSAKSMLFKCVVTKENKRVEIFFFFVWTLMGLKSPGMDTDHYNLNERIILWSIALIRRYNEGEVIAIELPGELNFNINTFPETTEFCNWWNNPRNRKNHEKPRVIRASDGANAGKQCVSKKSGIRSASKKAGNQSVSQKRKASTQKTKQNNTSKKRRTSKVTNSKATGKAKRAKNTARTASDGAAPIAPKKALAREAAEKEERRAKKAAEKAERKERRRKERRAREAAEKEERRAAEKGERANTYKPLIIAAIKGRPVRLINGEMKQTASTPFLKKIVQAAVGGQFDDGALNWLLQKMVRDGELVKTNTSYH